MKKHQAKPADDAEVNMTPMLDIVFIMLIFFIVASTLERESGLDVTQKNNNDQAAATTTRAVYVQICDDNSVFVDHRPVDIRSVRANVEAKLAADPNAVVVIETQVNTPTGSLVRVMDQAIEARAPVSISDQSAKCATRA
jgi:biopolymer transport protein ExbD